MEKYAHCLASAREFVQSSKINLDEHKILILVDLQGIYIKLTEWLQAKRFPLENGLILSRFAVHLLNGVIEDIKADAMKSYDAGVVDLEYLVNTIKTGDRDNLNSIRQVVEFIPSMELFYAPVLLKQMEWRLGGAAHKGGPQAKRQLNDIGRGIVHVHGKSRDYSVFDDFVASLQANSFFTGSHEGFYSYRVGRDGIKYFDEKEVDIRIAVRAMDACFEGEAQALCIVSSDQDFVPLHERCSSSVMRTYHADAANFSSPNRTGQNIKSLGTGYIETAIDPLWPMRIIIEACTPGIYEISMEEFEALCRLHNDDHRNSVKISPHQTPAGAWTIKMGRPA
jgi:hypothetical protein